MVWGTIAKFGLQVVGSYLISSLLTPNVRQTGSRLEDKSVQTSTYGASIPRIHGTCAVTGNVIWLKGGQLFDISVTAKGKKTSIGGNRSRTTVFPVFATFAVGLCEGPIAGIRRLWIGSDLVYDAGSDDIETIIASNQRIGADPLETLPDNIVFKGDVSSISERLPPWTFKIYYGTEDQEPSIAQEADKGVGNVSAYRGIAYIEIYNLPLEKYGNSLAGAQVKAEVVKAGTTTIENVSSVRKTIPFVDEFHTKPHYIDDEKVVFWKPNWDNTYPSSSTVDRYDLYHGTGAFIHVETRTITGISAGNRTGSPPDGDSDDETEFWSGPGRVFPGTTVAGLGAFSSGDGYIQRRGDVYAGISAHISKKLHRNTRSNVILNNPGISKDSTAFCFMIDGANIYEFVSAGINVLDAFLNTISTYSISFGSTFTSQYPRFRAQKEGDKIYLLHAKDGSFSPAGSWGYTETSDIYEVDLSGLTVTKIHEDIPGRNNDWWTVHIKVGDAYIKASSDGGTSLAGYHVMQGDVVKLEQFTATQPSLGSIVSSESQLSNYIEASDIDVTDITDSVRGYRVTSTGTIRSAIEPLQAIWPFDVYQSGYTLKFVRRGNAAVVSIPASKLDARPYGSAPGVELTLEREMDSQLPREVALKYLDAQREYDIGEQRAERKVTDSINKIEVEIPVSLTATEAAQAAEVMLWMGWRDRHDVSFTLPPEYGNLESSDVIEITGQWGTYTLRLQSVDYKTDGRLACKAKFEAAASYTSTAEGVESESTEQSLGGSSSTITTFLDIPCVTDEFNTPGAFVALSGYTNGWPGGVLWRSEDGGATWNDILAFPYAVTTGFAQNALTDGPTDRVDFSSVLEAVFPKDPPSSITYDAMLNFGNHFAYGSHGRWEIVAAQNAVTSDGVTTMSNFLRGRFGTEWAMSMHTNFDRLVMLSDNDIQWMHENAVNDSALFTGVTADADIGTGTQETFTYTGVNLKPLSGVYAKGSRHPSTNAWTASWIRRGRISIQWQDYIDVPVGEDTEAYEVDVLAYTDGPVVGTLSASASSVSYTEAEQLADAEFVRSKLPLNIYQMSATIGRGYVYSVTLEYEHSQQYETLISSRTPTRYWKMNETSGATVADSSGAADDLTFSGTGYTRNEDPLIHNQGKSALFGGASYLPIASNPLANPQRSYEAWVEYAGTGEQRIYDWQDSVGFFLLRRNSSGLIEALFQVSGVNKTLTAAVPSGAFHVVVTHSVGTMTLYLNGTLAGNYTSAFSNTGTGTAKAIGRTRNASTAFWQGHIDQFAIYDYELTADEVLHNYMAGIGQ